MKNEVAAIPVGPNRPAWRTNVFIYLGLTSLVWLVFGQTLRHQFVAYDDQNYVYENPVVTAGLTSNGVRLAFIQPHARNWHPLTTLSHMLDSELFGLNPAGHHLTNVLLHTFAALLLFSVLSRITGSTWRSAFVAAIFAIHPLRVESVAWVAERKDVLSAFFFMLTLAAYTRYVARPSAPRYVAVLVVFCLGLMAKPMLVTLPLLLFALDYWPLRRFEKRASGEKATPYTRLILEKVPLLILSAVTLAARQRFHHLRRLHRADVLAHEAGGFLSVARHGMAGERCSARRRLARFSYGSRGLVSKDAPLPYRGLALVSHFSVANCRPDSGWPSGPRGSLHVPAADRPLYCVGLARRRSRRAISASQAGLDLRWPLCCGSCDVALLDADIFVAEHRDALETGTRNDAEQ